MSTAEASPEPGVVATLNGGESRSPVQITPDLRTKLQKELGLNDDQLNAWLAMADPNDPENSLSPVHFQTANKETLNALQKSGQLTHLARELVGARAPVAMVAEVSNPGNWQKDQYIGAGAATVNAFIQAGTANAAELPLLKPPIDPNNISLDALVMSVLTQRAEIIEVQLREQISSIQQKNQELEVANDWLTKAKSKKANAGDSTNGNDNSRFEQEFFDYWNSLGAQYQGKPSDGSAPPTPPLQHNSADWDVNIEGLKAKIEALTSQSQLETTKLQQTINKYNQSFEMLSNFINKYYQSINTIIQNLR
ncbi:hypothetical protein [Endozoicomonas sp. Mp262]|uniref:hypothetical protein n=1 Tax=Endozoicomonas sp. Mp262 TaxID=2919499 RepID=UPI0021D90B11